MNSVDISTISAIHSICYPLYSTLNGIHSELEINICKCGWPFFIRVGIRQNLAIWLWLSLLIPFNTSLLLVCCVLFLSLYETHWQKTNESKNTNNASLMFLNMTDQWNGKKKEILYALSGENRHIEY